MVASLSCFTCVLLVAVKSGGPQDKHLTGIKVEGTTVVSALPL